PPNLLCLGLRRDVPQLLAASDAFVLTSANGEGFPNVVAEAMVAGLPVISTDVGDVRRMLGDTGTIVAPGDRTGMVAAITELLALPEEIRRARGERARERARATFSLQTY